MNDAPYYTHHIFCCLNQRTEGHAKGCCMSRKAEPVFHYLKQRMKELGVPDTRVNRAGCLDRCEHGPVIVIYPEGAWYRCRTREEAEQIIQQHVLKGNRVSELLLQ